jgi:hypothetical protein
MAKRGALEHPKTMELAADELRPRVLGWYASWRKPKTGYVYLMRNADGLHKIGHAKNPDSRRSALQKYYGFPITLIHCAFTWDSHPAERLLHEVFASQRIYDEWFDLTPDDVAWICEIREISQHLEISR